MQCGGERDAWQECTAQGSLLKHMSLLPALARQRVQADANYKQMSFMYICILSNSY